MEIILKQIKEYNKRLENEILKIVANQSMPLTEKNSLMEPIADQKKILIYTKEALLKIKNKKYEAKCNMSEVSNQ